MPVSKRNRPPVVAIGSGAFESILRCDVHLQMGGKHVIQQEQSLGGSGLNYTLRMLAVGIEVLPILPIGNDPLGKFIRESIITAAEKNPLLSSIRKVPGFSSILCAQRQNPPFHDSCQPIADYGLF
jgi:hypothetical protein